MTNEYVKLSETNNGILPGEIFKKGSDYFKKKGNKYNREFLMNNRIYHIINGEYVYLGQPNYCGNDMCIYNDLNLRLDNSEGTIILYYKPAEATIIASNASTAKNASGKKRRKSKSNKKRKTRQSK
jgi:hypothetical protein